MLFMRKVQLNCTKCEEYATISGMKLFIISDIHGSIGALERAVAQFTEEQADLLVICGDYLNHGPRNPVPADYAPPKVAELLNSLADRVVPVRGNCDSEVDQMLITFPCLAPYTTIVLPNSQRVFVHHGHLHTPESAAAMLPAGSIIVSGHTHIPVNEPLTVNGKSYTVCNPGSITLPKADSKPGYLLIECTAASSAASVVWKAL